MKPLNVIIAQGDLRSAENLAVSLQSHFKFVALAQNVEEIRQAIHKHRADVVIIDLEASSLIEIDQLRREFSNLEIVCTHRLADEQLWAAALTAGAADCVHPSDIRSIVFAANRTKVMARTSAA